MGNFCCGGEEDGSYGGGGGGNRQKKTAAFTGQGNVLGSERGVKARYVKLS